MAICLSGYYFIEPFFSGYCLLHLSIGVISLKINTVFFNLHLGGYVVLER